jgi:hypothetical protein
MNIESKIGCVNHDCEKCNAEKQEPVASPTYGMNLGQRIAHVGGRENAAGYIEFGSPMAVQALINHVLRDIYQRKREWVGLTDEEIEDIHCTPPRERPRGKFPFARMIEAKLKAKNGFPQEEKNK